MPKSCLKPKNCWVFGHECAGRGRRAAPLQPPLSQHEMHTHFCGLLFIKKSAVNSSQVTRGREQNKNKAFFLRIFSELNLCWEVSISSWRVPGTDSRWCCTPNPTESPFVQHKEWLSTNTAFIWDQEWGMSCWGWRRDVFYPCT